MSNGQKVSCGQKLGVSASSGNSTGYHLHFETRVGGVADDPFSGKCGGPTSFWVSQGSGGKPSAECENKCDCSPGETKTEACGNCGSRKRSCKSDCKWGSWGSCAGQGECEAGKSQSKACGDCGQRTRNCNDSCSWDGYGSCEGPDPNGGEDPCETGLEGTCADGRVRCVEGMLSCAPAQEITDEICDNLDNDCNGLVDDGAPTTLSDPKPDFAATVLDLSYPQGLAVNRSGKVWADIRNDGSKTWSANLVWLAALGAGEGQVSALHDPDSWAAYDVAAVLDHEVEPGEIGRFSFAIKASGQAGSTVNETFLLGGSDGVLMRCPSPGFAIKLLQLAPVSDGPSGEHQDGIASTEQSSSCAFVPRPPRQRPWLQLLLLTAMVAAMLRRRTRPVPGSA